MAPPTATDTITNTAIMQAPQSSQAEGAEKAKVKMQMPSIPVFEDKMKERDYLKGRLAAAFRIFGDKGYDEGKGFRSCYAYQPLTYIQQVSLDTSPSVTRLTHQPSG